MPEVRRKLREAQNRSENNLPLPPETLTVRAYMEGCLRDKESTLSRKAAGTYQHKLNLLLPEIGHLTLAKLQPVHLREGLRQHRAEGLRHYRSPLSRPAISGAARR